MMFLCAIAHHLPLLISQAASPQPSTTSSFTPSRQLLLTSSLALAPSSTLHTANPKSYFIIDPPLGRYAAEALADVLRVEWGLKKLVLEGGVIDGDEVSVPYPRSLAQRLCHF